MSELSAGKEVLSHCNKCKLTLAHTIVTMKDTKSPDKVMCKTCKGTHAYKLAESVKIKSASTRTAKSKMSSKKVTENLSDLWTKDMNKSTSAAKDYSIKGTFLIGDIITHPTFGQGIVKKLIDNNKIEVLFKDDYRTLMHKK